MAESQRPLTLDEAAAYLNVSVRFMRRLVAERRVAYHKLGALLRFRREDLDGFFAGAPVFPAQQRRHCCHRLGTGNVHGKVQAWTIHFQREATSFDGLIDADGPPIRHAQAKQAKFTASS